MLEGVVSCNSRNQKVNQQEAAPSSKDSPGRTLHHLKVHDKVQKQNCFQ